MAWGVGGSLVGRKAERRVVWLGLSVNDITFLEVIRQQLCRAEWLVDRIPG